MKTNTQTFHDDFESALSFVTQLHSTQYRKGTDIPYISHLIGVAGLVLEHGGNRDEAIAALSHDAIEDQGPDYAGGSDGLRAEIKKRFGPAVLDIVNGCTDADEEPKPPWQERKEAYISHLYSASESIRKVSCADKLHNARAILSDYRVVGEALWDRFKGGKAGSLWYYRALSNTFNELGPQTLASELERTVTELEQLAS